MADLFADATLPLKCAKCGHTTQEKIAWLEKNPEVTCPGCGSIIQVDADGLKKGRASVNKIIDDMRKKFR